MPIYSGVWVKQRRESESNKMDLQVVYGCWEPSLDPWKEKQVLSIAKAALQHQLHIFKRVNFIICKFYFDRKKTEWIIKKSVFLYSSQVIRY